MSHYKERFFKVGIPACHSKRVKLHSDLNMVECPKNFYCEILQDFTNEIIGIGYSVNRLVLI